MVYYIWFYAYCLLHFLDTCLTLEAYKQFSQLQYIMVVIC